jgi:hypothetical protein
MEREGRPVLAVRRPLMKNHALDKIVKVDEIAIALALVHGLFETRAARVSRRRLSRRWRVVEEIVDRGSPGRRRCSSPRHLEFTRLGCFTPRRRRGALRDERRPTGLSLHNDDTRYTGSFTYFAHPTWRLHWGGHLLILDPKTAPHNPAIGDIWPAFFDDEAESKRPTESEVNAAGIRSAMAVTAWAWRNSKLQF